MPSVQHTSHFKHPLFLFVRPSCHRCRPQLCQGHTCARRDVAVGVVAQRFQPGTEAGAQQRPRPFRRSCKHSRGCMATRAHRQSDRNARHGRPCQRVGTGANNLLAQPPPPPLPRKKCKRMSTPPPQGTRRWRAARPHDVDDDPASRTPKAGPRVVLGPRRPVSRAITVVSVLRHAPSGGRRVEDRWGPSVNSRTMAWRTASKSSVSCRIACFTWFGPAARFPTTKRASHTTLDTPECSLRLSSISGSSSRNTVKFS